jgi:hypothetical protein
MCLSRFDCAGIRQESRLFQQATLTAGLHRLHGIDVILRGHGVLQFPYGYSIVM